MLVKQLQARQEQINFVSQFVYSDNAVLSFVLYKTSNKLIVIINCVRNLQTIKKHRSILNSQPLILASTSTYRSELLSRLRIPFQVAAPEVDESPLIGESAQQTSWRLSRSKAQAVVAQHPGGLIIGSDQVALLDNQQLGKPHTHNNAASQLRAMRGNTVTFYTSITLLNALTGDIQTEVAINRVNYRNLTDTEIENYLLKEKPYNCAGSTKSEGLGIALISSMEGDDPNALIGLPLIILVNMLLKQHVKIL